MRDAAVELTCEVDFKKYNTKGIHTANAHLGQACQAREDCFRQTRQFCVEENRAADGNVEKSA